ncbi:MAG: ATP-binding protein, partial [Candidatus Aenigmarchaeota archaeon]|nr:ATP-binding protein [Candidatus Aenigmarchaeota archaeon]
RDDDDLRKYGEEGAILIGRHVVGTGEETHLTTPLLLDVLRPHLIVLCGKRGSGKSFSMGVIVEELMKIKQPVRDNICSLIIDAQGIFWTMKQPNEKNSDMLNEWGLEPRGFDVYVYVPDGQVDMFRKAGVDYDGSFSLQASQLSGDEWLSAFGLDANDTLGIILQKIIAKMSGNYSIDDIIKNISGEEGFEKEKLALQNHFYAARSWGIFGEEKMPSIMEPGKVSIIDVSLTPQNVRALLVSIVCKKVLEERITARRKEELAEIEIGAVKRVPMPWIFIDEAHNFLPDKGKTAATDVLNRIVREGRQPGISLVFATQRPEKLAPDALAQADMIISHRITAKNDVDALKAIMQTYLLYDIGKYIGELPHVAGSAIILDDNSERIYKIRVRPRHSWHAGSSPTAF